MLRRRSTNCCLYHQTTVTFINKNCKKLKDVSLKLFLILQERKQFCENLYHSSKF